MIKAEPRHNHRALLFYLLKNQGIAASVFANICRVGVLIQANIRVDATHAKTLAHENSAGFWFAHATAPTLLKCPK